MAAAYIAALMGSGAVISLLIAAFLLSWVGVDRFGPLIGAAIQIGAALCIIAIGVRLSVATWIWLRAKMVRTNG
ncbi:MAG: hypothetical protein ABIP07_09225 [Sphingomicrobium sp.]